MSHPDQHIRFCTSRDGTRIAYATCGTGPPLVWVQHWIHHLNLDWDNPLWRPWLALLTRRHTLIRYDWRGCGLSDRDRVDFSVDNFVDDLEAVTAAMGFERFALFGMSGAGGGIAMSYAVRHPERVTRLILHGCHIMGRWAGSPTIERVQEGDMRLKVYELGWPNETPAYGQFFTALHMPDSTAAQMRAYNDMLRETTSPANAIGLLKTFWEVDLRRRVQQVRCPTLVLHARGDSVIPFDEGRKVAALIPRARFMPLDSRNHLLVDSEPGWQQFVDGIEDFLPASSADPAALSLDELTAREREVLEVLAQGLDNSEIAARLKISEKTARNHLSIIFSKLGVKSRAQAIILARDAGFGHRASTR
jgi:pimeloyl-ACP methyl ester carboxylesterase